MKYPVIVRGFKRAGEKRAIIFQDRIDLDSPADIEAAMPILAEKHVDLLKDEPHMIEFEFPEEPEEDRFFRFGTDPSLMTLPLAIEWKRKPKMSAAPTPITPSPSMVAAGHIEESILYRSLVLAFVECGFPPKQAEALAYVESRNVMNGI